jgi:carbonic anhydrase
MAARTRATGPTADEALARRVEGNGRFRRGKARRTAVRRKSLADLAKGQRPYAT